MTWRPHPRSLSPREREEKPFSPGEKGRDEGALLVLIWNVMNSVIFNKYAGIDQGG
jgi:hypothetical protein